MKGIIFTEFMEMVEEKFSVDVVEEILSAANLESNGEYTSLGTYSHEEVLNLVTLLSEKSGLEVGDLALVFGEYLFGRFATIHADFFHGVSNGFDFMEKVEDYIHIEVQKLYPDANPPKLTCTRAADDKLELHYRSHRPFASVAEGLIKGCAAHFNENLTIDRQDLAGVGPGTEARFIMERKS